MSPGPVERPDWLIGQLRTEGVYYRSYDGARGTGVGEGSFRVARGNFTGDPSSRERGIPRAQPWSAVILPKLPFYETDRTL